MAVLKDILKKARTSLSQLQLDEIIFEVNSREEPNKGSAMNRFLGRGLRKKIPNSVDRSIDGKELIKIRRETREKRVQKKGRTVKRNRFLKLERMLDYSALRLNCGISMEKSKVSDLMKLVLLCHMKSCSRMGM